MDFSIADNARLAAFWADASLLVPEMVLALGMCLVLLSAMIRKGDWTGPAATAFLTLGGAFVATLFTLRAVEEPTTVFYGSLAIDPFSLFFKLVLLGFAALVLVQWLVLRDRKVADVDQPDFLCLVLGATLGMSLMASANNLLMILVATESASLPSFALAGFRKWRKDSTEGAFKYALFGAASSAVMIYGMSMIYGSAGSLSLSAIASHAAQGVSPMLALGLLAMFAGVAFKLSAAPMHFWCPDVFEAAPLEVTTFLSVASKGAATVMMVRILAAFGFAAGAHPASATAFYGLAASVAILGGVTAFWGNLVAYHQTNIKRLLAYSSIAHAGYMIMACAVLPLAGRDGLNATVGSVASGVLFYLVIYLFMNLGAFTIAGMIAQKTGSEDIRSYAGMARRNPTLAILLSICLLSLFGMPGLGGFMAKIMLAKSMAVGTGGVVLVGVLLINTLISLFYYMRPVVIMTLKDVPDSSAEAPEASKAPAPAFEAEGGGMGLALACAVVLTVTGLVPTMASRFTDSHGVLTQPAMAGNKSKKPQASVSPAPAQPTQPAQPAVKAVAAEVSPPAGDKPKAADKAGPKAY